MKNKEDIPQQAWDKVLRGLPEQEVRVVRLQFTLEGGPPLTIAQVARKLPSPASASARSRRKPGRNSKRSFPKATRDGSDDVLERDCAGLFS